MQDLKNFGEVFGPFSLWSNSMLEEVLLKGLTLAYEKTSVPGGKLIMKLADVSKSDLTWIDTEGPYFSPHIEVFNKARYKIAPELRAKQASLTICSDVKLNIAPYTFYATSSFARQISQLPRHVERLGGGTPYEVIVACAVQETKGRLVTKGYATVDASGVIYGTSRRKIERVPQSREEEWLREVDAIGSILGNALNAQAEKPFLYLVEAREAPHLPKINIGVQEAEIKSLFYSRSLPVTSTGRKRPLLHWVESHKRRLSSGIDIDVQKHLRGVDDFEMNGTIFKLKAPLN